MSKRKKECVLITGATSGIGYELAKCFAKDGFDLLLVARTSKDLKRVVNELSFEFKIEATYIAIDLFEPNAAFELYDEVKKQGYEVDILVNDAGQGQFGLFVESEIERLLDIIQLNIASLTALTHLFLRDMVARNHGRILQVASVASELPGPFDAVYHATKAFVLSLSTALVNELKDTEVTITALMPGVTDTDFFRKADMLESKAVQDKSKMADPADVAKLGYDALMKGDDKVVHGIGNKLDVAMSHVVSDKRVAQKVRKSQEPVNTGKKVSTRRKTTRKTATK